MLEIPGNNLLLFYCYAHEDVALFQELNTRLDPLKRSGWIRSIDNRTIHAGSDKKKIIDTSLQKADLILLLISPDFLASDECYDIMQEALRRHDQRDTEVIALILRPVEWQYLLQDDVKILPKNREPITIWEDRDAALLDVATEIRGIAKSRLKWLSLFFTHHDAFLAQRLKNDLEERGLRISCVDDTSQGTGEYEKIVRQTIQSSQFVLMIVSSHARSLRDTFRIAAMYQPHVQVLPIWMEGDIWQASLFSELRDSMPIDAREDRYKSALNEIVTRFEFFLSTPFSISSVMPFYKQKKIGAIHNPYKGLNAFHTTDARDFFGRDKLIQDLLKRIREMLPSDQHSGPGSRLLTVVGPSGSGKSSLIMAGLFPQLGRASVPEVHEWICLEPMVPGEHPFERLALIFAKRFPGLSFTEIRQDLEVDTARGLHHLASRITHLAKTKVVLLVDQFEELFTQTASEQERELFIDVLTTAVTEPHGPVIVVLTLRSDFYGHPMAYPALSALMQKHQVNIVSMNLHELRTVIEGPTLQPDVQLTFEDGLVGDVLFEVYGQIGALPLLQFTLTQLFERRNEFNQLTRQAYHKLGGVKGTLTKHAETAYETLRSDRHRELARMIFTRLMSLGPAEQDITRRRATLSEFVLDDPEQTHLLQETYEHFIQDRLLTTNDTAGVVTLEISHEALIEAWPRLTDWLQEKREDIPLQQTISRDADTWERSGRPKKQLYRSSQLKQARTWSKRNMPSGKEIVFLSTSVAQQRRQTTVITTLALVTTLILSTLIFILFQLNTINQTTVTTLHDSGLGSLRQVLATAPSGSTITFDSHLKGSIQLTSDDLNISRNLNIQGPGAALLAIRSVGKNRSIQILQGASVTISGLGFRESTLTESDFIFNQGKLSLLNVSITDNTAYHSITNAGILTLDHCTIADNNAFEHNGGGISNTGTLSIIHSTVSGNTTSGHVGGGISNDKGTLTIVDSIVSRNRAVSSNGGGISNTGTLTVSESTIAQNIAASGYGGGIFNDHGTVKLTNSIVAENISNDGNGGGIANLGALTMTDDTVSHNTSIGGNGGGIDSDISQAGNATFTLTNSTISGNRSSYTNRHGGYGGGLFIENGRSSILFCTIYDNTAIVEGGGIASTIGSQSSPLVIGESIVASNHAQRDLDLSGTFISGYDLLQNISETPADSHRSHDITGVSPGVGPLQNNGGLTPTHALLWNSPAIDQIPTDICHLTHVSADQRNVKRPQGVACDIGSYEYAVS